MSIFAPVGTAIGYTFNNLRQLELHGIAPLTDPASFISGGIAGAAARAAVIPFDAGGVKGPIQTVGRRVPHYAIMLGLYVPLSSRINCQMEHPTEKLFTTFFLGTLTGMWVRLICNPVNRLLDEAARMEVGLLQAAKVMKNKTWLQFYYTSPPIFAGGIYIGVLLTCFEGIRRFIERQGVSQENVVLAAFTNAAAGGIAAGVSSTLCYPYSSHRYLQTVIHDSAICRGIGATLMKVVPMTAFAFGMFSLCQPLLAPHLGKRSGFGC